ILFVGAMVFVFYLFTPPPMLFEKNAMKAIASQPQYAEVQGRFDAAWKKRARAAEALNAARKVDDRGKLDASIADYRSAQREIENARRGGIQLYEKSQRQSEFNDTNYIFLSFVTRYFPAGVVGLVIAVIFTAAMSSSSGELNSLAAVSVMDIY